MSIDETKRAAQITKAYAEDWDGLTQGECKGAGFSDAQCNVLVPALGKGAEGNITADDQKKFEEAGFAKEFIKNLTGDDGNKALQSRVRWLADRINPKEFIICWTNCDSQERDNSVKELGRIGPAAAPAVPALIAALKDENWRVRDEVVQTLGRIGPAAAPAIPSLIAALKDENSGVRGEVVWTLGNIGPAAASAIPSLIAALKDEYPYVRYNAAWALGKIGPAAVSALIAALKDEYPYVRSNAAWALGNIGLAAVPALIAALKDEVSDVRYSSAEALGRIGDPLAIPPLQKMIREDPDLLCRQAAQKAFDKIMEKLR